jgi:hypothetical protein
MNLLSSIPQDVADLAGDSMTAFLREIADHAGLLTDDSRGPQRQFKLRLAANPSHTDEFGPWHLADHVGASNNGEPAHSAPNDAYAIRYRVL